MQQCGFCSMLSGLLRRAMCVGSRRDSTESYYRELGDQDTLKIEDRSSDLSDEADEIHQESEPVVLQERSELSNMLVRSVNTGRFLTLHKRRKKRLLTRSLRRDEALLDDLQPGPVQCILDQSCRWKFNAFTLDNVSGGRCLTVLCIHLFHIYGLISYFKLDAAKAWRLFTLIEEGYHSTNPYHNSIHAADVTQAMHCFLQQRQIRDHLEPLEIMASLLAAIAHDMDHPGVNQSFLISTSNHLAALYQNKSVLENHHWRAAMSCLIQSGLFDGMGDLQPILERKIGSLILATDITRQTEYLSQFKTHMDTNTLDLRRRDHRHLVLQIALKCADISNPCRSWEISRKWSLKVCEEFFRQGDFEKRLKLPVTALCDRHSNSIPKIQTGFFKFVVTPLITEWHRFLQNDLSAQMLSNLQYNRKMWDKLFKKEMFGDAYSETSDSEMGDVETGDVQMIDDDIDHYPAFIRSDSFETLLPPRRNSLNPTIPVGFKQQLRRFSAPLTAFQDSICKNKEKSKDPSLGGCSESADGTPEKVLSSENLLPDCTIASITTPVQAIKLKKVFREGSKLIRQQTFPPLEPQTPAHSLISRPLHMSNEDAIFSSRTPKTETGIFDKGIFVKLFKKSEKTGNEDASENNVGATEGAQKENKDPKPVGGSPESPAPGAQLRDNLSSVQLELLTSDEPSRRRKSAPTDVAPHSPKEKKMREASAIPEKLHHSMSMKECWSRRRGSAPAPVAPSELRGLAAARTHSVNGAGAGAAGRKKPGPIAACQHWLAKATHAVQDGSMPSLLRRSSLPVEAYHPIEEKKRPESK